MHQWKPGPLEDNRNKEVAAVLGFAIVPVGEKQLRKDAIARAMKQCKGSGHRLLGCHRELGFAMAEPRGGQEAQPSCALPQGGTLPQGMRAQLAQAGQHTSQLKPARPCFSLAEVPAAFRNPDDKVQLKRKDSRSYLLVLFQISNCSPLNCSFLAIIHEKNSCLSCFN